MVIITSGKQGAGKTTITKLLVEKYNGHHIKFADPLYEINEAVWDAMDKFRHLHLEHWVFSDIVLALHNAVWDVLSKYGVPREEMSLDLIEYFTMHFKRTPWHAREKKSGDLLQWVGTEFGRKRDKDLWVNIAKRRITKILNDNSEAVVVIDDCRFENEFSAMDEFSPLKVRLECDRDVRKARAEVWRDNEFHTSETALDIMSSDGMFDLYFDTEEQPVEVVMTEIEGAIQDVGLFGEMQPSPTTFTHVSNKYFDKGFKTLEDGRSVGTW